MFSFFTLLGFVHFYWLLNFSFFRFSNLLFFNLSLSLIFN
jgi:hypothetical protein